jgi:CO dehydrogenase maturation factor
VPLSAREDLVRERIGSGYLRLNPDVSDLPGELSVELPVTPRRHPPPGRKRLLTMGSITGAGDGCACAANALLKSVLAHLVLQGENYVLVDLEAGVEHLGRGTVAGVDALVVVSEPSRRSLGNSGQGGRAGRRTGTDAAGSGGQSRRRRTRATCNDRPAQATWCICRSCQAW